MNPISRIQSADLKLIRNPAMRRKDDMVTRTGLQQLLVSCFQIRSIQYVPGEVRVTFNQIHAHERVHGETTEADQEESNQQRDERP